MKGRAALLLALTAGAAHGAYVYDYSQNPVIPDSTRWSSNGSPAFSSSGVTFSASGSLISIPAISGANPNDYEINTTLSIKSGGGTYIQFFRASSGTVSPGSGNYISAELAVPAGFTSPGLTSVAINQCVSGTVTQLAAIPLTVADGVVLRGVIFGSDLWIFENNVLVTGVIVSTTSGNPGIGGYGMPSGSGFSSVKLGPHDVIAPAVVSTTSIVSSVLPNQVSLRWQGVTDDPNGIGLSYYTVYRNGVQFDASTGPEFTDPTVQPSTNYYYQIIAVDFHGNGSISQPAYITTPPAQAIDPRRVGVVTTGSYWGGGGEQIDTLSGNLNFTLPLVTAQGRNGWAVPVGLSYNSQNWRQDVSQGAAVNWQLGYDVGYGFGWKAQIGSLTPYYVSWWNGVDHYVYEDGTGAQYRLDQSSNGVWWSNQGIYVWFDSNANVLHFKDGTFWNMGCTSGGTEADAGTMYPTIVEDVNGNQVIVQYMAGAGLAGTTNTSARIATIEDVRGMGHATYTFTWDSGAPIPHLTKITNSIGTSENFFFTYAETGLAPPWPNNNANWTGQTTNQLASLTPVLNWSTPPLALVTPYTFTYDTAGASELMQVTFPYGGYLRWAYGTDPYSGSRNLRAVSGRYLMSDYQGHQEWSYGISRDNASSQTIHGWMTVADASGVGAKTWNFIQPTDSADAWKVGLISTFAQLTGPSGTALQTDTYTWSQTPPFGSATAGSPYISAKTTTTPGTSALSSQTMDQYGNVLTSSIYPYGVTATPLQSYTNTYLASAAYTANYIYNRLLTTTMTSGSTSVTLTSNTYDGAAAYTPYGYQAPTSEMDANPPIPFNKRGLLSSSVTPVKSTSMNYYSYGGLANGSASDGSSVSLSADSNTNYAAPQSLATQSYSESVTYNAWLGITQTTGANGEQLSMTYDSTSGRPTSGTSAYGSVTSYSYSHSGSLPATQTQTGPMGTTVTTLDGLGRAIHVVSNGGATDTVYAPCACSPLMKVSQVSAPYAAGGSPAGWTTYTYDGLGRTLTTQLPDGASTTSYSYSGNQTTVTDPAGKWKTFTSDVSGNLTTVLEPDPANQPGGTLTTSYTYDWMNHLTGVSMPRSTGTQTRSFVYDNAGRLTSATNPENGTVTYSYNPDNTLRDKHDAKGQDTVYTYGGASRVTMIQRYPKGVNGAEDTCQRVQYSYDTNPYDTSGTFQYTLGRLSAVLYSVCAVAGGGPTPTVTEMYSYSPAGGVTIKRLHIYLPYYDSDYGWWRDAWSDTEADFSYTGWGAQSAMRIPAEATNNGSTTCSFCGWHTVPVTFYTGFDSAGRPDSMTDNDQNSPSGNGRSWVQNVVYDFAGRMTSQDTWTGLYDTRYEYFDPVNGWTCCNDSYSDVYSRETRAYNVNGQLTSQLWSSNGGGSSWSTPAGNQYTYAPAQNNGQATQATEGGETITYQYDALKRLISAAAAPVTGSTEPAWTQSFQYDGFGNLTAKVLNGTSVAIPVDAMTNRLTNATYDDNGNMVSGVGAALVYDEANRLASATEGSGGTEQYAYAPDNKRIVRMPADGSAPEWTLWGPRGEKAGAFNIVANWAGNGDHTSGNFTGYVTVVAPTLYFAGRKIWEGGAGGEWSQTAASGGPVSTDRLGSAGVYYPYGDTGPGASGGSSFGTYARSSFTGLDYADQRYYASTYGRFNTPDPYAGSAGPKDPSSWNRFAYVGGDPVNLNDPRGLMACNGGEEDIDECLGMRSELLGDGGADDDPAPEPEGGEGGTFTFTVDVTASLNPDSDDGDDGDTVPVVIPLPDPEPQSQASCVAGSAALGALWGAGILGPLVGTGGAVLGGLGGTAIEPGGGTAVGGYVGFEIGAGAGTLIGTGLGGAAGTLIGNIFCAEHKDNARPSTKEPHQIGQARKGKSRGPSTHPKFPPRVRPPGWKGPWPPKPGVPWR